MSYNACYNIDAKRERREKGTAMTSFKDMIEETIEERTVLMDEFERNAYEHGRRRIFEDVVGVFELHNPDVIFRSVEEDGFRSFTIDMFYIGLKFNVFRYYALPEDVSMKQFVQNTYDLIEDLFDRYKDWCKTHEVHSKNGKSEGSGEAEND